jgi:type IV fimbrial biogenesis protein FimT
MNQTTYKIDSLILKPFPQKSKRLSLVTHFTYFNQKGFSLTELIIVIGLTSILLLIAVPNIGSLVDNSRLRGATRLVWGDLQNAKMTAIKTNGSITVTFNTSTNYSYSQGGGTTFAREMSTEYPNITITNSGGSTITFSSTGMTSSATITVQGTSGSKTISVYGTGRVIIN